MTKPEEMRILTELGKWFEFEVKTIDGTTWAGGWMAYEWTGTEWKQRHWHAVPKAVRVAFGKEAERKAWRAFHGL